MKPSPTLPEKFLERLNDIVPKDKKQSVFDSFTSKRPISIRVNTLRTTPNEVKQILESEGFTLTPVSWFSLAFIIDSEHATIRLSESQAYSDGLFYIQSLTSMIPVIALDPKPEEKILDIAAAPGSKTTQIASLMENTGEIVANDISNERLYKLRANLRHQGVTNTKVTNIPGQLFWKKFPEYFDRTLVDAPCSLEGRISLLDPKSYAGWSPKKIDTLSNRERYLLRSAISATKVGGSIIYSTCTLSPEENEAVINWILGKEHGKVVLEDIIIDGLPRDEPILHWKNKPFLNDIKKTIRLFPSDILEGFYVAKFKKIASSF